jgi:TIR domain
MLSSYRRYAHAITETGAPLIFVSHAAVDEEIALSLKSLISGALKGVEVFVSSDPTDLPLGDPWVTNILNALEQARLVLVLATERGLKRPWVWFETGRTWFSPVRCIPCCLGKTRKSALPAPFNSRQAMNLDETDDLERLFAACSKELGIVLGALDLKLITNDMIRLDVRAEERQKVLEDPFSFEKRKEVDDVIQTLDPGSREALRLVLKYGDLTQRVARDKIQIAGKMGSNTLLPIGLADRTGWLIKTGSDPHPLVSNEEDRYAISPTMKPYIAGWFEKNQR